MNIKKWYVVIFILILCLCPYIINGKSSSVAPSSGNDFDVTLYRTATGKTEKIPLKEYLCGVVAAEMQADSESEALKAQCVAACSYTLYRYENAGTDTTHPDAYVCDDCTHCKSFLSKSEAKKRWGADWFNKYYKNIEAAVTQVYGQVMTYDGEVINAVFHAISSGTTESAENVWGADVPYLRSVDSAADTTVSGYESEASFTVKEAEKILSALGVTVKGTPDKWFDTPKLDSAGSVASVKICSKTISGTEVRRAFGLRSTAFAVTVTGEDIVFTVHGYGHQVGMSQSGANELAKEGKSYAEILQHYYKGIDIRQYNF